MNNSMMTTLKSLAVALLVMVSAMATPAAAATQTEPARTGYIFSGEEGRQA